jgi:hypothetical protein
MWLLYTNSATNIPKRKLKEWYFEYARRHADNYHYTVDNRLWCVYKQKSVAKKCMQITKEVNKGLNMRLTLKEIKEIPSGWS